MGSVHCITTQHVLFKGSASTNPQLSFDRAQSHRVKSISQEMVTSVRILGWKLGWGQMPRDCHVLKHES